MSGCNDKIKNSCGNRKNYATCIYYESDVPDWSELKDETCVVIEETTQELYNKLTEIINNIDVSGFETDCDNITILKEGGVITIKSLLQTYLNLFETILCPNTSKGEPNDIDVSGWGLDLSCYSDVCNNEIKYLSQLLISMTEKQCKHCIEVETIESNKVYTEATLPDVILVKSSNSAIEITLPSTFCKIVTVKVKGLSNNSFITNDIDTSNEYALSDNEKIQFVFDGTNIISI